METINVDWMKKKKEKKLTIQEVVTSLPNKVQKVFIDLYNNYPHTKVQHFIQFPKKWIEITDLENLQVYIERNKTINHRSILKHEVVIDVDSDTKEYGKIHLTALEKRWDTFGYKREQWDSGGSGYHSHYYFKQLNNVAESELSEVKKMLITYLCEPFLFMYKNTITKQYIFSSKNKQRDTLEKNNLELVSHICMVDKKLIQIEWAIHRKGNIKRPFITDLGFINNAIIEGTTPQIPKRVRELIEEKKERRRQEKELHKFSTANIASATYPACIRFYLGEKVGTKIFLDYKDGANRAMFHLISFFKHTKTEDELSVFILEWINKVVNAGGSVGMFGNMTTKLLQMHIKSNKGLVGCKPRYELLEELGCDEVCKDCPYKKL